MRLYEEKRIDAGLQLKGIHQGFTFILRDDGDGLYFYSAGCNSLSLAEKAEIVRLAAEEACLPIKGDGI